MKGDNNLPEIHKTFTLLQGFRSPIKKPLYKGPHGLTPENDNLNQKIHSLFTFSCMVSGTNFCRKKPRTFENLPRVLYHKGRDTREVFL